VALRLSDAVLWHYVHLPQCGETVAKPTESDIGPTIRSVLTLAVSVNWQRDIRTSLEHLAEDWFANSKGHVEGDGQRVQSHGGII
jgi:hypothetical protein